MKFIRNHYTQVLKKKYKCPHCGEYSINLLNKMTLDNRYSKKCKICGKKYGPLSSLDFLLCIIATALVYCIYILLHNTVLQIILYSIVSIAVLVIIYFMPIVKK